MDTQILLRFLYPLGKTITRRIKLGYELLTSEGLYPKYNEMLEEFLFNFSILNRK